jgi:hypothetical protein
MHFKCTSNVQVRFVVDFSGVIGKIKKREFGEAGVFRDSICPVPKIVS